MQITIETKELNPIQMGLLIQIINPFQKPYQPELPFEGAVIDTSLNEKPKRTRRTKAEIEAENAQNTQEVSEVVQEEIVPTMEKITLSSIKTKAQDLVQKVSRDAVKNTINKYAEKISEVKESDYHALMLDFEALEA